MNPQREFNTNCPIPIADYPNILLAHGGGGKLTRQLIQKVFAAAFKNPLLDEDHDGAVFELNGTRVAFTTDSYVVRPIFFPGGDIGALAVNGTVNDLAMCGARPLYLSAGFILEEGFPTEKLCRVVSSMQKAAEAGSVQLVTGDTKVVDKGKGDGIFINTAGVGVVEHGLRIYPRSVRPGDMILLNGDIGRHGIAIMAVREGLSFETTIESDTAAVSGLVIELLNAGIEIHCLRDLTRGGLASALNEIAETAHLRINIEENSVPIREEVAGACEILGLDPLYVANEGRFVAFVAPNDVKRALEIMRGHPLGKEAAIIGRVEWDSSSTGGLVTLTGKIGTNRILDLLSGEQLPRIC